MKKFSIIIWSFRQIAKVSIAKLIIKVFLALATAFVPVAVIIQIGRVLDMVSSQDVVSYEFMIMPMMFLVCLLALNSFFFYGSGIIATSVNASLGIHLKYDLVEAMSCFPAQSYFDKSCCDKFQQAEEGMSNIADIIDNLFTFISSLASFVISLIVISRTSIWCILPIIAFFAVAYRMNMLSKKISHNTWLDQTTDRRYAYYLGSLFFDRHIMKEIKTWQTQNMIIDKWSDLTNKMRMERLANDKKSNSYFAYYHVFSEVSSILVLLIALWVFEMGEIGAGDIVVVWQLSKSTMNLVQELTSTYSTIYYDNEKIGIAKSIIENSSVNEREIQFGEDMMSSADIFDFELKDVWFAYSEERNVLQSINMKINRGETVAIFGENGSGKSTLINLMTGLYKPSKGKVLIRNKEAVTYKENVLGIAFQEFVRYPFSFRENVGYGFIEEICDDISIRLASQQGSATDILERCGIDGIMSKTLDNEGNELSGGEWQRVAISRANMGQKSLMVYDEPSAKLDPISELNQFQRLKEVFRGRTIVLVSHRIGFAKLADRIVVLKDGKIVEDGSHAELMGSHGEYKRLYDEQVKWYDIGDQL